MRRWIQGAAGFQLLLVSLACGSSPTHPAAGMWTEELRKVPVSVDGEIVNLDMRIYLPVVEGRVPTLVFNHGSTGSGDDASLFTLPIDYRAVAFFFAERGWAVVIPARRGRAGSEGLYDEGFGPIRALGYSCEPQYALPGADRALRDISAAMEAIIAMPFVDPDRIVMGGHSRGGILSVAYAGANSTQLRGVINFVGGWLGALCPEAAALNAGLFARGGTYKGETLWIYGEGDPFYSLSHSRGNFEAFQAAGGKGTFESYSRPGVSGHQVVAFSDLWGASMEAYLQRTLSAR